MTQYVLGFYRRVPNRPSIPDDEAARIQEAHLANIHRLSVAGELIAAGPLEEDTDLRGILLFTTGSVERARELSKTDPAILRGRLFLELYTWFAPAGLRIAPPSLDPTDLDFRSD